MAITISGSGITSANIADGTIVNADINSSAAIDGSKLTAAGGKVLQVITDTKTDKASGTNTQASFVALSGLSATITPSSTSSRILIIAHISVGASNYSTQVKLRRDSSSLVEASGDDDGNPNRITAAAMASTDANDNDDDIDVISFNFVDSPSSTSAITYDFLINGRANSWAVNAPYDTSDNNYRSRAMSSITLMEIGA